MVDNTDLIRFLEQCYPFHKTDHDTLQLIADQLESESYHKGERIFLGGEPADNLYLVFKGSVELRASVASNGQKVTILESGDYLGYDTLENNATYITDARGAEEGTTLLVLKKEKLVELAGQFPWFYESLILMHESYQLAQRVNLDWVEPHEQLYYIGRQHLWYLVLRFIPTLLMTGILLPILIYLNVQTGFTDLWMLIIAGAVSAGLAAWGAWNYLDWANDYAVITNLRVVYQERVILLYESRQEAPINSILAVSVETDQWGRILHYGTVAIRTYAGLISLPRLKMPRQVASMVEAQGVRANLKRSDAEKRELGRVIQERLGLQETDVPGGDEGITAAVEPGKLQLLLNNLFRMRFVRGDTIVYRTHWLHLLVMIFLPTLFLTCTVLLWGARMVGIWKFLTISQVLFIGSVLFFVFSLWWLYQYVDWRNDIYVITPELVLDINKKPLGREERRTAPLKNIQSIEFSRNGLLGILFNYGTVLIRVGDTLLTFDEVFSPSDVQRELFNRITESEHRERQAEIVRERERMTDFIEAYHHILNEGTPDKTMDTDQSKTGRPEVSE